MVFFCSSPKYFVHLILSDDTMSLSVSGESFKTAVTLTYNHLVSRASFSMGMTFHSDPRTYFPILHGSTINIYIIAVPHATSSLTVFPLSPHWDEQQLVTSSSSAQSPASLICPTLLLTFSTHLPIWYWKPKQQYHTMAFSVLESNEEFRGIQYAGFCPGFSRWTEVCSNSGQPPGYISYIYWA